MAEYIDRTKLKEDSQYNPVSGEYLSYSRGQIWNSPVEKVIGISVLNKIRAEIEELDVRYGFYGENISKYVRQSEVLQILDKYKEVSEGEE